MQALSNFVNKYLNETVFVSVWVRRLQRFFEAGGRQAFPEQTSDFQVWSRRKALRVRRRPADDDDATPQRIDNW